MPNRDPDDHPSFGWAILVAFFLLFFVVMMVRAFAAPLPTKLRSAASPRSSFAVDPIILASADPKKGDRQPPLAEKKGSTKKTEPLKEEKRSKKGTGHPRPKKE